MEDETSGVEAARKHGGGEIIVHDDSEEEVFDAVAGERHSSDESDHASASLHHAPQLAELVAMGFTDVECNRLALDESGGDLGEALELLIQWS